MRICIMAVLDHPTFFFDLTKVLFNKVSSTNLSLSSTLLCLIYLRLMRSATYGLAGLCRTSPSMLKRCPSHSLNQSVTLRKRAASERGDRNHLAARLTLRPQLPSCVCKCVTRETVCANFGRAIPV